jgi:general secretion pathway protein F
MLMKRCPHCGADNSAKRETCYNCQQALAAPPEQAAPAAASRWQAIDLGKTGSRPLDPLPQAAGEGAQAQQSRSYMPTFRRSLKHVRRMGLFFRELHTLTRSGITIAHACQELSRRNAGGLGLLAGEMATAATQGQPIYTVMEKHRDLFYPWHIGLIRAAQEGAYLPEAFDQIARGYEVERETRSVLLSRLTFYVLFGVPPILVLIPLLLMLNQPIPKDGWTLETMLQAVSYYFRATSLPIVVALVALVLIWQAVSATAWFQGIQQRIVIRLPLIGRVARAAALERYLGTLGLLLRGGVPVTTAAAEAAAAAGSVSLTPRLMTVGPAVQDGMALALALENTRAFDRDTLNMAATGEASGSLPDMLSRAATYYGQKHDAERRILLRLAGIAFGVFWLCLIGAVIGIAMKTYFDFAFRVGDWMME